MDEEKPFEEINSIQFLQLLKEHGTVVRKIIIDKVEYNDIYSLRTIHSEIKQRNIVNDCIFKGQLLFTNVLEEKYLYFNYCTFEDQITFIGISHADTKIKFHRCIFSETLVFQTMKILDLKFSCCYVKKGKKVNLHLIEFVCSSLYIDSDKYSQIVFTDVVINHDSTIKDTFIYYCKSENIYLQGNIDSLYVDSLICDRFDVNPRSFSLIQFTANRIKNEKEDLITREIQYNEIGTIDLSYLVITKDSIIKLEKIDVRTFKFSYISNNSQVYFTDIQILEKFEMISSVLNNTSFNNLNLKKVYPKFSYSDFSKAYFNIVTWNKDYFLDGHSKIDDLNEQELQVLQENYRNLKKCYKNQSNNIEAVNFYRNEMLVYEKTLKVNNSFYHSWQERCIIYISKVISNFGQDLFRPLGLLLIGHSILFFLLVLFKGLDIRIDWSFQRSDGFPDGIGLFFYFLNPVHKFDPEVGHRISLMFDGFIRLWSAFCIYHIIKASRKYMEN